MAATIPSVRPVGRIGGSSGSGPLLAADWDCCSLDTAPIDSLECWAGLLAHGRLKDVLGAFAVAWTGADGSLNLARDPIGERTLYYAETTEGLVFASTLRALVDTGLVQRELDPIALTTYLTYAYLPGRRTLVRGVKEVLPGEVVTYRNGSLSTAPYWQLPPERPAHRTEDELRTELRAVLEDAVCRRLPPGSPVAATLSGGIDSSLVVALARRLHAAPLHTYSISFGPDYRNELPFSSMVAEHCGTVHHVVELSSMAVLSHMDEVIGMLSDPIGDPLTVPNALVFRQAAAVAGVVLNGEGGDPCFGGPKNIPMLLAELFGAGDGLYVREQAYLRAHLKCYDDLDSMLSPEVLAAIPENALESELAPHFAEGRWSSFTTKLAAINIAFKGGHHILPKVDALSAPAGVLPRSPLFDRRIVELAVGLPPTLRLNGAVEKYLLKQAVRDLLPPEIVARPKSGMMVPVEAWFRGPLLPEARERLLGGLRPRGLFQADYLERLLDGRLGGLRPRHGAKIWLLLTLESWLRGHGF